MIMKKKTVKVLFEKCFYRVYRLPPGVNKVCSNRKRKYKLSTDLGPNVSIAMLKQRLSGF